MTTKQNLPIPLFDTLEHIQDSGNISLANHIDKNDYLHSQEFLICYRGSEATFNAYRRELERLLQWCGLIAKKNLRELKRTDIEAFIEFCQSPPLAWIATKKTPRYLTKEGERVPNHEWRPFVVTLSKVDIKNGKHPDPKQYTISQKALQAVFAVLGSFFNYLIHEEYLGANPVSQIRQKSKYIRKQQNQRVIRRLSELQWGYVLETAAQMAAENSEKHERTLFIMNALYGMYLRISELAASERWVPQMGDFHRDMDGNWWFTTVGKGNKERQIVVCDAMLNALKRYRESLDLTPLPSPGESTPLIKKTNSPTAITSTRHIREIVQRCFDKAYENMVRDNLQEDAEQLTTATVHWLRHTGISDDVKHRPREHVRDDAGHGSSAITDKYIDVEKRERHASGKKKEINPLD